jgi:subtilisin family serine protease
MQKRYNTISGTSMATPHVAGIAALYAEANPNASAQALWNLLTQNARRLSLPSTDAGIGLVQAP